MARLKSVKWINRENVIDKVKQFQTYKVYKYTLRFNYDNTEVINNLINYIFKDKDYIWSSEIEDILRAYSVKLNADAFGIENKSMTHKYLYMNYWHVRGWSKEQSIEILHELHDGELFTCKDDILNYFNTVNSHDINLNNKEYK